MKEITSVKKPSYEELERQLIELKRLYSQSEKAKLIEVTELNNPLDEEAIKISNEFLDKIINNVYAPIFVKDNQGRHVYVNQAFCNVFELPKANVLGKTLAEHIPIKEQEHFLRVDREVLETGKESLVEEVLTLKGKPPLTIVTKKTRFSNNVDDKFIIGVIHDITDAKNSEIELIKSKEYAEKRSEELVIANKELFFQNGETEKRSAELILSNFSLHEKEVLLKEIHHRVKNNLQVITSLLGLQSSRVSDDGVKALFRSSQNRINVMSSIHEMLYQSDNFSEINYSNYLNKLLSGLLLSMIGDESDIELIIKADSINLNIDTAVPLGLLINEIVTNALKYGVTNKSNGVITLVIKKINGIDYEMLIGDNGAGFPEDAVQDRKTLGLKLIRQLTRQIKGVIKMDKSKKGTNYIINFQEINIEL